jgi:phosphatidylserine synthase
MWSISAFFDNFDGSFAALFKRDKREEEFGRELDSLIDCVSFAVVPIVCLRLLAFPQHIIFRIAFVVASFLFIVAAVTRLGYFNILTREGKRGFTGMPTTETVLLLATILLFPVPRDYIWTALACLAVPMILPIEIAAPKGIFKIVLTSWLLSVIALHLFMHFIEA